MKSSNLIKFPLLLALPAIMLATGCSKKFEDYSQNRNLPLSVPAGLSLRAILGDMVVYPGGFEDKVVALMLDCVSTASR